MNTEKYDLSLFTITLIHSYKTMITKAITSAHNRRHRTPKEYTNTHKSTSGRKLGCTELLNSMLESKADESFLEMESSMISHP